MIASDPCASSRAKAGHARGARPGFRGGPRARMNTHPVLGLQVSAERRRHDLAASRRRRGEVRLARLAPAAAHGGGVLHFGLSTTTCDAPLIEG